MEDLANYSGEQLLSGISFDDLASFEEIYRRYRLKVINYIRRFVRSAEEAEDLAQDVFVSLWEGRGKMGDIGNADAFIYVICRNVSTKALRKKSVVDAANYDGQYDVPSYDNIERFLDHRETRQVAQQAIESLPPQAKLVFQLSREQGLSCEAISRKLGISKNTVYNHIKNSLRHIRNYFASHSPDTVLSLLGLLGFLGAL